jgi:hypothetical protein
MICPSPVKINDNFIIDPTVMDTDLEVSFSLLTRRADEQANADRKKRRTKQVESVRDKGA